MLTTQLEGKHFFQKFFTLDVPRYETETFKEINEQYLMSQRPKYKVER
jgi:hypothetical protein